MLTRDQITRIQPKAIRREPPTITTSEALELCAQLDRDLENNPDGPIINIPKEWEMPTDDEEPVYGWKEFQGRE